MKRILWLFRVFFARLSNFFLIWSEADLSTAFQNHFGKLFLAVKGKSNTKKNHLQKSQVSEVMARDIDFLLDRTQMPSKIKYTKNSNNAWIWATPIFNAGSGGHHDIFMLADESQSRGVKNIIGLINGDNEINLVGANKIARESYGYKKLAFTELLDFENQQSDLVIATGWQTFASAMHIPANRYAYLVQDFEPNFYSPSIQGILAEATYKKSVPCLTAGPWLAEKLRREYGLEAQHFELGFSDKHYGKHKFHGDRNAIVVYYRPGTSRRASELMLEVLRHAASKLTNYKVHFVGGKPQGKLPFDHVDHGQMTHEQLGDLYGQAAVTCLFSLTNTSLVPVEALACGSNVFTNRSESNLRNLMGTNTNFFEIDIPTMAAGLVDLLKQNSSENHVSNSRSVEGREWDIQKKIAIDYLSDISYN